MQLIGRHIGVMDIGVEIVAELVVGDFEPVLRPVTVPDRLDAVREFAADSRVEIRVVAHGIEDFPGCERLARFEQIRDLLHLAEIRFDPVVGNGGQTEVSLEVFANHRVVERRRAEDIGGLDFVRQRAENVGTAVSDRSVIRIVMKNAVGEDLRIRGRGGGIGRGRRGSRTRSVGQSGRSARSARRSKNEEGQAGGQRDEVNLFHRNRHKLTLLVPPQATFCNSGPW